MNFFVYGTPKAQPRPRAFVRGKHAGVYDAGTANDWKYSVARAARENAPKEPFKCALKLKCTFFLPRPKNHFYGISAKRPKPELRIDAPLWNTSKPDIDNYIKAVMDALTDSGVVWTDDSQVARIYASKTYESDAAKCGVGILIEELEQ